MIIHNHCNHCGFDFDTEFNTGNNWIVETAFDIRILKKGIECPSCGKKANRLSSYQMFTWVVFLVSDAIWGLACVVLGEGSFHSDEPILMKAPKLAGQLLCFSLPMLVFSFWDDRYNKKHSGMHVFAVIVIGIFSGLFLGLCLYLLLGLFSVRHFLGIPILNDN